MSSYYRHRYDEYDGYAHLYGIDTFLGSGIGLILLNIFFIVLIILGSMNIYSANKRSENVIGTITKTSVCKLVSRRTTNCDTQILYTIDGKSYEKNLTTPQILGNVNDKVNLFYDPKNIENIYNDKNVTGYIILVVIVSFTILAEIIFIYYYNLGKPERDKKKLEQENIRNERLEKKRIAKHQEKLEIDNMKKFYLKHKKNNYIYINFINYFS